MGCKYACKFSRYHLPPISRNMHLNHLCEALFGQDPRQPDSTTTPLCARYRNTLSDPVIGLKIAGEHTRGNTEPTDRPHSNNTGIAKVFVNELLCYVFNSIEILPDDALAMNCIDFLPSKKLSTPKSFYTKSVHGVGTRNALDPQKT